MDIVTDQDYPAYAFVAGVRLSNADIQALELDRARHALAYLTHKLGNDAMRKLLADGLLDLTTRVRG